MTATPMAKIEGALTDVPGSMFIGLKDDGRLAVCYLMGERWGRFRNDWHGASEKAAGTADFDAWVGPNWNGAPRLRNIAAVESRNGAIIFGQTEDYRMVSNFQTVPGSANWSGWSSGDWMNAPFSYEMTAAG